MRQWTITELNRVHPLPGGWWWQINRLATGGIEAVSEDSRVFVGAGNLCLNGRRGTDTGVIEAVILASKRLDSFAAMAWALEDKAEASIGRIAPLAEAGRHERAYHEDGHATGLRSAAAMLRRGTVAP